MAFLSHGYGLTSSWIWRQCLMPIECVSRDIECVCLMAIECVCHGYRLCVPQVLAEGYAFRLWIWSDSLVRLLKAHPSAKYQAEAQVVTR